MNEPEPEPFYFMYTHVAMIITMRGRNLPTWFFITFPVIFLEFLFSKIYDKIF